MMAKRLTREDAQALYDRLPDDKKKLAEEIAAFREECAKQNRRCGRLDVRDHFSCGSDLAVKLMRIQDALRSEEIPPPTEEPAIPFAFAMISTKTQALIGRSEEELNTAFAKAVADERDRYRAGYEAIMSGLRTTNEGLSERLYEAEAMLTELSEELAKEKDITERLTVNSVALLRENTALKENLTRAEKDLESLQANFMALTKEIIDIRALNTSMAGHINDLVPERDALRAEAEALRIEVNQKDDKYYDLLRENSKLRIELDAVTNRLKIAETARRTAEQQSANEIAALADAVNSLTAMMQHRSQEHRPSSTHA